MFAAFLCDTSTHERADADHWFPAKTGGIVASSRDYKAALRTVALPTVPHFTDWCIVDLVDEEGQLYLLIAEHMGPSLEPLLQKMIPQYPPESTPHARLRACLAPTARSRSGYLRQVIRTEGPNCFPVLLRLQCSALPPHQPPIQSVLPCHEPTVDQLATERGSVWMVPFDDLVDLSLWVPRI